MSSEKIEMKEILKALEITTRYFDLLGREVKVLDGISLITGNTLYRAKNRYTDNEIIELPELQGNYDFYWSANMDITLRQED